MGYRDEPEFESGQIVVHKERCWKPLALAMWMNENSDFWYQHIHGDKDTFHLAWRKLGVEYAMPSHPIHPLYIEGRLDGVMCQHDFGGRRIFQHRNFGKWTMNGECGNGVGFLRYTSDLIVPEFTHERECFACLNRLRAAWGEHACARYCDEQATADEAPWPGNFADGSGSIAASGTIAGRWVSGSTARCAGRGRLRADMALERIGGQPCVALHGKDGLTCILLPEGPGRWRGNWLVHERTPVQLITAGVRFETLGLDPHGRSLCDEHGN